MKRLCVFLSILLGLSLITTLAMAEIKIPGRTKFLVNDYTGVLSQETKAYLEKLLSDVRGNDFIGTEIEVTALKTLDGMPPDYFMQEYLKRWRRPFPLENDNRIHIILMLSENKIRIGIGRYLQHVLTQQDAKNIIEKVILSEFKYGNYDAGIKKGVEAIIGRLKEGGLPKSYTFVYVKRLFLLIILVISALIIAGYAIYRKT